MFSALIIKSKILCQRFSGFRDWFICIKINFAAPRVFDKYIVSPSFLPSRLLDIRQLGTLRLYQPMITLELGQDILQYIFMFYNSHRLGTQKPESIWDRNGKIGKNHLTGLSGFTWPVQFRYFLRQNVQVVKVIIRRLERPWQFLPLKYSRRICILSGQNWASEINILILKSNEITANILFRKTSGKLCEQRVP